MIISAGGPSIDVNIDKDFFTKYPFIDFAMYGAGEQAFLDLVTSLLTNKKLIQFNTSNIAWFDKSKEKTVLANFKYVPQHKISPFLHNEELFTKMVKALQKNGISVVIPYELTRGCPYSCTFCDWNSGLTNKVTRRKGSFKDEIDLFQKLKIKNIYLSDANVGQYEEDIEMISYFAEKNINEKAGFLLDGNYSKLRKENNLKIYLLLGKANLVSEYSGFTISVQDINPQVLRNIERPDVGWDIHLEMINKLKDNFPHLNSKIQLIQGLPGQTVNTWRQTLAEISKYNLLLQPFISELLPASPAARDKEYQEKFKFEYSTSERYEVGTYFKGTIPKSCFSFSQLDFVKMTILTAIYSTLVFYKTKITEDFNIEDVVDEFLSSKNYHFIVNNLYENWNNNKFYFTINLDLKPAIVSASHFATINYDWKDSLFLLKLIAKHIKGSETVFVKKMLKIKGTKLHVAIEKLQGYV
jgi:hypothetical protein